MPRWSEVITLDNGTKAIVCYSGKQRRVLPSCGCGARSTIQCDYPIGDNPPRTCDAYLCRKCAKPQGRNRDYCPNHEPGFPTPEDFWP